ncbi:hypothetical protein DSAG12_02803 [Promethearchaeum syntrophicum]|uniref:Uncharacterized protein n=1 Tax=Promethearchaeum syntrophicum TaxID=2594042 RepID=A0A5B9DCW7_9ARCH|nr:hypothetical protein [Candidatus Prometheoarchaeum syntrophicum]QEE16972.1 hypothetical protein DSAG12_02803 [Candidatus Prometheoarchaeum syntrophicum]
MSKITTESKKIAQKFFKSKEFFPIETKFGEAETIRLTKRPRKAITEIIDIYSNDLHIGMFIGIEKIGSKLIFGPAGMNRSHSYRGILNFTFIKLLEYFGLDGVKSITIDVPEDMEFKNFLSSLGFTKSGSKLLLEIKIKNFLSYLEKNPTEIASQVGQIRNIIQMNATEIDDQKLNEMVDKIVDKIKNMDPLGKSFWDNRKIAQLNYYLSTAIVFASELEKEEFLDLFIKTTVCSLDTHVREPYLEDIFLALEGKRIFDMPYVQIMIEKIRSLMPEEIKALEKEKDHFRKWVYDHLPTWKLNDKLVLETRIKIIKDSQLTLNDFGGNIQLDYFNIIQSLIDHYNGANIFFGMNNRV